MFLYLLQEEHTFQRTHQLIVLLFAFTVSMANNSSIEAGCILPYEISDEQWVWYNNYAWWIEGFGCILIGSLGIILNTTSMVVLMGSFLGASFFNWLLVFLAFFDNLFLVNGILEAFRNHIGEEVPYYHSHAFVNFLYPFRSVVLGCSMYMTILLALERYNALANPTNNFSNNQKPLGRSEKCNVLIYLKNHRVRLFKYIGPIILLSSIYYAPKYMELYVATRNVMCTVDNEEGGKNNKTIEVDNCTQHFVSLTDMRKSNEYILWYLNVSNLVATVIIPIFSLIYLNFNIYLKYKQYVKRQPSLNKGIPLNTTIAKEMPHQKCKNREKDVRQQTLILFVIVISFGLSHFLRICLNIDELISLSEARKAVEKSCEWIKWWNVIAAPISHLLLQINCSVNFFIYCLFNQHFKRILVERLRVMCNTILCNRPRDDNDSHINNLQESPGILVTTQQTRAPEHIELNQLVDV